MVIFKPDRYLLEKQIEKYSEYIKGRVLDVGAGSFRRYQHIFNCDEYMAMDPVKGPGIDAVGQAESIPFEDNSFDSIVCTQVFGDVKRPRKAAKEFLRVLRHGGMVLLTDSQTSELHDEPSDYWRFTKFGLREIFEGSGFNILHIDQRGGFFSSIANSTIRYLIDRLGLYNNKWPRFIMKPIRVVFAVYGRSMIALDSIDGSRANKKHAIGWCIIAKKM